MNDKERKEWLFEILKKYPLKFEVPDYKLLNNDFNIEKIKGNQIDEIWIDELITKEDK